MPGGDEWVHMLLEILQGCELFLLVRLSMLLDQFPRLIAVDASTHLGEDVEVWRTIPELVRDGRRHWFSVY